MKVWACSKCGEYNPVGTERCKRCDSPSPKVVSSHGSTTKSSVEVNYVYQRPRLIVFLAILNLITTCYGLSTPIRLADLTIRFGIPTERLFIGYYILGVMAFAATIGMLRGSAWGWWLGGYFYLFAIARNVDEIIIVSVLAQTDLSQTIALFFGQLARILGGSLVLYYLFTEDPRGFMGVLDQNPRRDFMVLCGMVIGTFFMMRVMEVIIRFQAAN